MTLDVKFKGLVALSVWVICSTALAYLLAYLAVNRRLICLPLRWDCVPGVMVFGSLLVITGLSYIRKSMNRWLGLSVLLMALSIFADFYVRPYPIIITVFLLPITIIGVYAGYYCKRHDAVCACLLWGVGVYIQAVYIFNVLACAEAMNFFGGGEII